MVDVENTNCETKVIWKWINQNRELNHDVSQLVISSLKKHTKPKMVCRELASSLYDLISESCTCDSMWTDLAACTLVTVDWDKIARAIMKEVIFGNEISGENN